MYNKYRYYQNIIYSLILGQMHALAINAKAAFLFCKHLKSKDGPCWYCKLIECQSEYCRNSCYEIRDVEKIK